jgi:hypothetical protein
MKAQRLVRICFSPFAWVILVFCATTPIGCKDHATEASSQSIRGKVTLVGPSMIDRHDGIVIKNATTMDSVLTDTSGLFELPIPSTDGTFRITASYVYFDSVETDVVVRNKEVNPVWLELTLRLQLLVRISTERTSYQSQDTMRYSIHISNLSFNDIVAPGSIRALRFIFVSRQDGSLACLPQIPNYEWDCKWPYTPGQERVFADSWKLSTWGLQPGFYDLYVFSNIWYAPFPNQPDMQKYARIENPALIQILP